MTAKQTVRQWSLQQLCKYATVAIARRRPMHNSGTTVGSGVFCMVLSKAISLDHPSSVQLVQCCAVEWSKFVGE
jgi:hypothetical protein